MREQVHSARVLVSGQMQRFAEAAKRDGFGEQILAEMESMKPGLLQIRILLAAGDHPGGPQGLSDEIAKCESPEIKEAWAETVRQQQIRGRWPSVS